MKSKTLPDILRGAEAWIKSLSGEHTEVCMKCGYSQTTDYFSRSAGIFYNHECWPAFKADISSSKN